jgi:hypothetical protein
MTPTVIICPRLLAFLMFSDNPVRFFHAKDECVAMQIATGAGARANS